ncbi:DUF421 domain-containing protein [Rossellomorea sp. RS05]|uniref:DUF421 domain-containing protein n=1 Tax=Rossellomorea sp. RS05 TaxID=3149166 RepID=UPI0032220789
MEGFVITLSRTIISFILLILITSIIGKHINSHKNHYSFALSVTIGSSIANMGFDTNLKFFEMLFSFIALIFLFYLSMVISSKSRHLRKWLSGRPTVFIENGRILDHNMKKTNFSLDDLNQLLREKDIFDISEVEYAILEVSGDLSILKKEAFQNPSKSDLHISSSPSMLPIELIMEGEVIKKNTNNTYTEDWIVNQCSNRHVQVRDVYYGVINSKGNLIIDLYSDRLSNPTDIE